MGRTWIGMEMALVVSRLLRIVLAWGWICASIAPAVAQTSDPSTGNGFYEVCNSSEQTEQLACIAYLRGVADGVLFGNAATAAKVKLCFLDKPLPYTQQRDILIKYLREHPERRHEQAAALYILALANAVPCRENE